MTQEFYNYFYLLLRVEIKYGKIDARASGDKSLYKFYCQLEELVKNLIKATHEYIETHKDDSK